MNVFIYLFSLLFTQNLWAFKMQMEQATLDISAGVYSATATIQNDSDGMIAIEASPRIRKYSKDGTENFDNEAEDLIIVPSQMIVPAGGEQVLNIRWIGPRDITVERAYRLVIEYVSVSEDKLKGIVTENQKAGININYRIAKSFYVSTQNAKADIDLQKTLKKTVNNQDMLHLSLVNLGTKHFIAHSLDLQLSTTSNEDIKLSLSKKDLGGSINFLAQEVRELTIPWPAELKEKDIAEGVIVGFGNK